MHSIRRTPARWGWALPPASNHLLDCLQTNHAPPAKRTKKPILARSGGDWLTAMSAHPISSSSFWSPDLMRTNRVNLPASLGRRSHLLHRRSTRCRTVRAARITKPLAAMEMVSLGFAAVDHRGVRSAARSDHFDESRSCHREVESVLGLVEADDRFDVVAGAEGLARRTNPGEELF